MIKIFVCSFVLLVLSCSNQTIYSGKILNQENLNNLDFKNKQNLINKFGNPSFIDPIENKFFYYSEKKRKKSAFNQTIDYSYVFVFVFGDNDEIIDSKVYDLKEKNDINFISDETSNEIVQRGLIEKIFGGVGPQQEITSSP